MKVYSEPSFVIYITRVSKLINPNIKLSSGVKDFLQKIIISFIEHFAMCSDIMMENRGVKTLSSKEINHCVQLFFTGELRKKSTKEGLKAITKFVSFYPKKGVKSNNSEKTGIFFPPCRVRYVLGNKLSEYKLDFRISETAPVFLSAVIEYLVAEILELAGVHIKNFNRNTILTEDVKNVIKNDDELNRSLCRLNLI